VSFAVERICLESFVIVMIAVDVLVWLELGSASSESENGSLQGGKRLQTVAIYIPEGVTLFVRPRVADV
jgi:hypothetical protein